MGSNNQKNFERKQSNKDPPPLSRETLNRLDTSHIDPSAPGSDDALTLLLEGAAYAQQEASRRNPNQIPLPMLSPTGLKVIEEILGGPSNPPILATTSKGEELRQALLEGLEPRSNQPSPATTKDLHPGYPYRENIDNNEDLPQAHYPRPYLAAQVNRSNRDPRILGRTEKKVATYNEGPLKAQPMAVIENNIEDKVTMYSLGENAYLDTDFLRAMGDLDDRGLAADGLRLIQLDGEFQYLKQWERRLAKREQDIHLKQGDLIQKKRAALSRQMEVYKWL
jgi:hypothetical protein